MAQPKSHAPALRLAAIFSRYESALDWSRDRLERQWGDIALTSQRFEHQETDYYTSEMGSDLFKQFLVFRGHYDPANLADAKLQSNAWEAELSLRDEFQVPRPINIDPGYVTLTKLVLASAKDRAHRIYLRDGIYAEECLYYLGKGWQSRPWTYPDYQRRDFQAFFLEAREFLKSSLQPNA